jgi:predicted esterase
MASGEGDFNMWKPYADTEGFVLIAPNLTGEFYTLQNERDRMLKKLVDEVAATYRIDRGKILLAGFSWGGQFAYRMAMRHPEFAHTVAVFSGANFPPPSPREAVHPTFYLSVGSEETTALQHNEELAQALKRLGYPVTLHVDRGRGHSMSPQAIVDVLKLVRTMKGATG